MNKFIKNIIPRRFSRWYKNKKIDLFLISYPKAGRTWLRMLIGSYFNYYFDLNIPYAELSLTQRLHKYNSKIPKILLSILVSLNYKILRNFIVILVN